VPAPRRERLRTERRSADEGPRFPRRPPLPIDAPITPLEQRVQGLRTRNGVRLPPWGMMPSSQSPYRTAPIRKRAEE
jgi:hypothetical protein